MKRHPPCHGFAWETEIAPQPAVKQMLGDAIEEKICKRFDFAMFLSHARAPGDDDVIIVVESSSTGQRREPCLLQGPIV